LREDKKERILHSEGMGRLDQRDSATAAPVRRYQRDWPGELIHADVKKIAGIPDGGGPCSRGRGYAGEGSPKRQVGYRFIHTALDDRTRLIYSEILAANKPSPRPGSGPELQSS